MHYIKILPLDTIKKKAEPRRIDAFELWCWRRLLRVPWTARRYNQFILKEISPGCTLEGLMLKLKLQYFGHLMQRVDSLEKTLMLGGIGKTPSNVHSPQCCVSEALTSAQCWPGRCSLAQRPSTLRWDRGLG